MLLLLLHHWLGRHESLLGETREHHGFRGRQSWGRSVLGILLSLGHPTRGHQALVLIQSRHC